MRVGTADQTRCRPSGTAAAFAHPTSSTRIGLPYVIVYEFDEAADEVAIIAVFHGAQDRDTE
jgi:plasmid stabilization system protein ParE